MNLPETDTKNVTSETLTEKGDILASVDTEAIVSNESGLDILSLTEEAQTSPQDIIAEAPYYEEILRICESIATTPRSIWQIIKEKLQFFAYYIGVSCIVFVVLLIATNYSAYFTILANYINPAELKASSQDIARTMDNSKIEVYANESDSKVSEEEVAAKEEKIKKELEDENVTVKDTFFSPKKLIPAQSDMALNVEIMPYENRVVIPKLGKNIPLVDVPNTQGVSFDNLEDKFMTELEKGIIRYPGTAKPGEEGNSFIFGHSSNYPWMKGDYNDVFALLDNLVFGDQIIVYYNQHKYVYVIREKKIVHPGNVSIMKREEGKKELSLMTCWPVGTALNRLLVFAELQEDKPQQ